MDSSFYGMGWMTQRQKRCFCYDFFFLRQKPTRWGEFTFQLETSSFLSKEKTRSKTFSTFEFNMVVEALAFQKYSICWVFRSYSVQPHFQCKLKSSRVQRRQQIADVRTRLNLRNQPAANLPLSQRLSVDRSTECLEICPQYDPLVQQISTIVGGAAANKVSHLNPRYQSAANLPLSQPAVQQAVSCV